MNCIEQDATIFNRTRLLSLDASSTLGQQPVPENSSNAKICLAAMKQASVKTPLFTKWLAAWQKDGAKEILLSQQQPKIAHNLQNVFRTRV